MIDLRHGDCVAAMRAMPESSIDAIVTDPPYGLEFMGKKWDSLSPSDAARANGEREHGTARVGGFERAGVRYVTKGDVRQPHDPEYSRTTSAPHDRATVRHGYDVDLSAMQRWHHTWAAEALRVLKPGAHLLAFGGTRTHHRLMCALEDAGFEIRDCLMWLYGSGFPKSRNIGNGWGTALKPAYEPIVLARKPLSERNVAANVLRHGTGAINVDVCRLPVHDEDYARNASGDRGHEENRARASDFAMTAGKASDLGRWPANLLLDSDAAAMLDEQSGELVSGTMKAGQMRSQDGGYHGNFPGCATAHDTPGDTGGASRFFYTSKAGRAERNAGLAGMDEKPLLWSSGEQSPGTFQAEGTHRAARNHHPTVKPIDLMCWLVRLVTPPGGTVLDPFMGSGSTGMAALRQGFSFIGIEREEEYLAIARRRIEEDAPVFNRPGEIA